MSTRGAPEIRALDDGLNANISRFETRLHDSERHPPHLPGDLGRICMEESHRDKGSLAGRLPKRTVAQHFDRPTTRSTCPASVGMSDGRLSCSRRDLTDLRRVGLDMHMQQQRL